MEGLAGLRPLYFLNDAATTEIYTLSLHDALPISPSPTEVCPTMTAACVPAGLAGLRDRKSTRLNSSHLGISYADFCLKKKLISLVKKVHTNNAPAKAKNKSGAKRR